MKYVKIPANIVKDLKLDNSVWKRIGEVIVDNIFKIDEVRNFVNKAAWNEIKIKYPDGDDKDDKAIGIWDGKIRKQIYEDIEKRIKKSFK